MISLILLLTGICQAETIWILGDYYVAKSDGKKIEWKADITPNSWSFNAEQCSLWVEDEDSGKLFRSTDTTFTDTEQKAHLLSDATLGTFFTRSPEGMLQLRNSEGVVKQEYKTPWVAHSKKMIVSAHGTWSINDDRDNRKNWLGRVLYTGEEVTQIDLLPGMVIWPNHRLLVNETNGDFWLGYSTGEQGKPFTPIVEHRDREGNLKKSYRWKDKGLFHDFCMDRDHSVLVSRDIPSDSGFTVPLDSFLERLMPGKESTTELALASNLIADGLACAPDAIYFAEHSLFGSEGRHLQRWDRNPSHKPVELFDLPGPAQKLYHCL